MITHALIVRAPYAQMIVEGKKTLEMRSRNTERRGRIGIIEAGTGRIIGEVDLVGSRKYKQATLETFVNLHRVEDFSLL